MVTRPVFIPEMNHVGVRVISSAPFAWNPGFSMVQKKKNVAALHSAIKKWMRIFFRLRFQADQMNVLESD